MFVSNKITSKKFREILFTHYPILEENKTYAKLTEYLLLSAYRCKETGRPIISKYVLGSIEGKTKQYIEQRNYTGLTLLDMYSKDVQPVEIHEYRYVDKLSRTAIVYWPEQVQSAILGEFQRIWDTQGKVYFVSGEPFTEKTRIRERRIMKQTALSMLSKHEASNKLLDYLNNLPPNKFSKLLNNLNDAYLVAVRVENDTSRQMQINLLRAIEAQAQPFYKPADNTTRVFALNESLLGLKRDVRHALCKGWYEADLKAAQLAVVSRIWNLPELKAMIEGTTGIWNYFYDLYGVYEDESRKYLKDALKPSLYSTVYGMGKQKLQRKTDTALAELGIIDGGATFLHNDIIGMLLDRRTEVAAQIKKNGGAYDAFGTFLPVTKDCDELSIMAQQAQSYELLLLWPVVELAKTTREFSITAWQHDGMTLDFMRSANIWSNRIKAVVKEKAAELGIPTELEITELR